MFICPECKNTFNKLNGLLTHMLRTHGVSSNQLYDKTYKKEKEGLCKCCGAETKFKNFTLGYNECCSNRCAGTLKAINLKKSEKYNKFVEKVRVSATEMHSSFTEEKKLNIIKKRVDTLKANGFYEKHSKTMKEWWNNADENTKVAVLNQTLCKPRSREETCVIRKKAVESRIKNGNAVDRSSLSELKNYRTMVNRLTNLVYKTHIDEIDPNRLRGRTSFHIDHKVSILEGFLNKVSPEIISHKNNLRLIPAKQNISKSWRSSITLTELMESIYG